MNQESNTRADYRLHHCARSERNIPGSHFARSERNIHDSALQSRKQHIKHYMLQFVSLSELIFFTYAKKTKGMCPRARTPVQKQKQTLFCTNNQESNLSNTTLTAFFFAKRKIFFFKQLTLD